MDNATNPVQGTKEINQFPAVEWEVITRRLDVVLEGLMVVGIVREGVGTLVVVLKWTGRPKIWILAALAEEVRSHLIITGVCCLDIAPLETVLLLRS